MAAPRALVTGAGGFIGRWSVAPLLARGFEVHAVLSPDAARAVPEELTGAVLHRADLLAQGAAAALCGAVRATHLLHFAWIAAPGVYWTSPDNGRWLEAGGRLLQAFADHGGARAVLAGSCAEYDWTRAGVCREFTTPLADAHGGTVSPYAAAKLALQRELAAVGARRGLSAAWGRIFFQYGPHEHPQRLVPSVVCSLLAGSEALCTQGTQRRSFLHVADVGAAFAALLDSTLAGPVNVGAAEPVAVADLALMIGAALGRPDLVRLGARPTPAGEPDLIVPDVARLQDELGWRPRWDLPAGLADTIAWWRRRGIA